MCGPRILNYALYDYRNLRSRSLALDSVRSPSRAVDDTIKTQSQTPKVAFTERAGLSCLQCLFCLSGAA